MFTGNEFPELQVKLVPTMGRIAQVEGALRTLMDHIELSEADDAPTLAGNIQSKFKKVPPSGEPTSIATFQRTLSSLTSSKSHAPRASPHP